MKKNCYKIYKAYYSPTGGEYYFDNKPTKENLIITLANDCDYSLDDFSMQEFHIYPIKVVKLK